MTYFKIRYEIGRNRFATKWVPDFHLAHFLVENAINHYEILETRNASNDTF